MKKLPVSKQITFGLIVAGVAVLTSFLLAFFAAAAAGSSGQPGPSPLIGLSFGVVAGVVYLALANNKQVDLADDATRSHALSQADGANARLIVFREGFVGKLAGVDVYVDDVVKTQLKSPRFAVLPLAPGRRTIQTEVQGKRSDPLSIDAVAGETAAVQIVVRLGKTLLVPQADIMSVRDRLARVPMVMAQGDLG